MPALPAKVLQPALRVGAVNDPAEREAEAMAARVVSASGPTLDASSPPAPPGPAAAPLHRATEDQPNLDQLTEPPIPAEQAEVAVAGSEDVSTEGLDGADTSELDGGKPVDTAGEEPAPDTPPIEDAPPPVLAARGDQVGAVVGRAGGEAPADVAGLVAHPGPGRPLPETVRQRIESHFGVSFDAVRVHDTAADKRAAARIGARAFTHRSHIWLGRGESVSDTRLMAHELTHVVQQTTGSDLLPLAREPVLSRFLGEDWLEGKARHIPGYTLMTVLLGRKLISGDRVQMTGENLLGGFLGLIPGGTLIFDRLKETRVIQKAFAWVRGRLSELNLTGSRIRGILNRIPGDLSITSPFDSLKRLFGPLVRDIITFIGEIKDKILEFIIKGALKLAGPYAERVWAVIQQARDTIGMILSDPLRFAKNLVRAIVGGFSQFGRNILEHLKKGLLGWLFGSLKSAGIEMPAKLDFKGLISLGLQILGLTYENFRKRLVKKLGPKGEKMVSMMEKSVEVVKILMKEGFAGIWQKMLTLIDNFKQTLIGGISTMVISTIVRAGLGWLAGLSNPVGAVIKVVLAIYDLIVAFIERIDQIVDVARSIFSSIGSIVRGQVAQAANFIEQTIGRTVPVVISFLAALLGLGGISGKIRDVIKKLRAPVDRAIDKLLTFMMKKAKKLFSKLIAKVNKKRKFPSANFRIGARQHRIFAKKKGRKLTVMVASGKPSEVASVELANKIELKKIKQAEGPAVAAALAIATKIQKQTKDADDEAGAEAKKVKPGSEKENQLKKIKALEAEIIEAAKELEAAGKQADQNPAISSQTEAALFRAAEPRLLTFEGEQDTHKALMAKAKGPFSTLIPDPISSFYEMDHTIEKRFPKAVLENLQLLDPAKAAERKDRPLQETRDRADRAGKFNAKLARDQAAGRRKGERAAGGASAVKSQIAPAFGKIGQGEYKRIPETAPNFPAVAVYRHNHVKGKGLKSQADLVARARKEADPHAHLKTSLKAQLNLELKEMQAQMDADKSAPDEIRQRMKAGLAKAKTKNKTLYDLANVTARTVEDKEKADKKAKDTHSVLSFEGGNGAPNFLQLEGKGAAYGSLKGMTEHLERDHIVDKAYPPNAASLPLLSEAEAGELQGMIDAKLAADNQTMNAAQRRRLDRLKSERLYPAGTEMAKYSEASGYAIPLYKPLARKVTSKTGGAISPAEMAAKVTHRDTSALADHVISGDAGKLDAVRSAKRAQIAPVLRDRTTRHSAHVAEAYSGQLKTIPEQQVAASRKLAKAHMTRIAGQVSQSLSAARAQTELLLR